MPRFVEFLLNHPVLTMAFLGISGGLVWTLLQGASRGGLRVGPGDAVRLINDEDALVVDVRGEGEFNQGHVIGARNVPLGELTQHPERLDPHRGRTLLLVCRNGQQSARAAALLRGRGFEKVHVLAGGMLAWQEANLPVTKK